MLVAMEHGLGQTCRMFHCVLMMPEDLLSQPEPLRHRNGGDQKKKDGKAIAQCHSLSLSHLAPGVNHVFLDLGPSAVALWSTNPSGRRFQVRPLPPSQAGEPSSIRRALWGKRPFGSAEGVPPDFRERAE